MRLLLDTHYLVWLIVEQNQITTGEQSLLMGAGTEVRCSAASLWELRLKWARRHASGSRKDPVDPARALDFVEEAGWPLLDLTPAHATTPLDVPLTHSDPFDELLLVQAQVEGLRLLTRDARLGRHPLAYVV